MVPSTSSENLW